MHTRTPHMHLKASVIQALIVSLVWGPWLAATAAPAQLPLLKRGGSDVDPNIFYTIDDSGSMGLTYAPTNSNTWPGENNYMKLPNGDYGYVTPIYHPSDTLVAEFADLGCTVRTPAATDTSAAAMVAKRLRASYFNKIYYNPAVTYNPWARGNPTDNDFGNVSFKAAEVDPRSRNADVSNGVTTTKINLEAAIADKNNRYWCTDQFGAAGNYVFYPATYYRYDPATAKFTQVSLGLKETGVPFYTPEAWEADTTVSAASADRTDCVTKAKTCTLKEEQQNFANWFSYYRTRSLLARGASSIAFSKLEDPIRVGYGRINFSGKAVDDISGAPTQTLQRGVRDFTVGTATRKEFFNWLYSVPASGGTPLRRAMDDVGRYFSLTDTKGPWGNDPGKDTSTKIQASCRKSYHILMTDGYWNGAGASAVASGNVDGSTGTPITSSDGKTYTFNPTATMGFPGNTRPTYADKTKATLADVAAYYWGTDLNTKLANNVKSKQDEDDINKPFYSAAKNIDRGDHAFWQHLTTYTVGLGIDGTIKDRSLGNTPPVAGWPVAAADTATAVDDLWHAAVNGRGEFLQASNPKEFQKSLESVLNSILGAASANTGVALSGGIIRSDTLKYVPSFVSPQWYGDVKAFKVNDLADTASPQWSASQKLPGFSERKLFVWNASALTAFDTSLSSTIKTKIGATAYAGASDDLINFLRGDRSKEGSTFRCRGDEPDTNICKANTLGNAGNKIGLFGDVVNSTPVLLGEGSDRQYQFLPKGDEASSYRAYLTKRKARGNKAVVAVGANDGFFHFLSGKDGTELLAAMPSSALDNIGKLSNKDYGQSAVDGSAKGHRFFVDGPITDADAYIKPPGTSEAGWRNVVLSSAGGGGKSVFAFNVPVDEPSSITSSAGMWEITPQTTFSTDSGAGNKLGYVTSPIVVGRMANGKWAALFGNGLDSNTGNASLWIVDLETGQPMVAPIEVPATGGNGLGGVSVVTNSKRVVVAAYAGDAKGNVWRFDLQSESAGSWGLGLNKSPLIATGKHITAAPTYLSHPKGGLMVLFGTGKLYAAGDDALSSTQTLYGVWDVTPIGAASTSTGNVASSKLSTVKLSATPIASPGGNAYPLEGPSSITYTDANGSRGWKIDMSLTTGERVISSPYVLFGLGYFNSVAPAAKTEGDPCDGQTANNFLYVLDPLTGNMPAFPVVDTNGDDKIDLKDTEVSRIVVPGSDQGTPVPVVCSTGDCEKKDGIVVTCATGTKLVLMTSNGSGTTCAPRVYNQRFWTQIANPPR